MAFGEVGGGGLHPSHGGADTEENEPLTEVGAHALLPRGRRGEEAVDPSLHQLAHLGVVDDEVEEEAVELAVALEEGGRRVGLSFHNRHHCGVHELHQDAKSRHAKVRGVRPPAVAHEALQRLGEKRPGLREVLLVDVQGDPVVKGLSERAEEGREREKDAGVYAGPEVCRVL